MELARKQFARVFWLVMLLGHIPAVFSAAGALQHATITSVAPRLLLLALSLAFFSLKIANVHWLRLPRDRRVLAAVVTIFVLLHADVVRRTVSEDLRFGELAPTALVTIAAVPLAAIVLRRAWRRMQTLVRPDKGLLALRLFALRRRPFEALCIHIPILQRPAVGLRAPPFRR